jgi:hypothetical protein
MQARGSLSGESLEVLEQALDLLGEEFNTHAQDRPAADRMARAAGIAYQTAGGHPSRGPSGAKGAEGGTQA